MKLRQGMREKGNGIEYRFQIDGERYSVYGKTVKEVLAKETDLRLRLENGQYRRNNVITIEEYSKEWIERKMNVLKGTSIKAYKVLLNAVINPRIGNVKVQAIDKRMIEKFRSDVARDISASRSNYAVAFLHKILDEAVDDEIIAVNPCKIKMLKVEKKATENIHRALTREEQAKFIEHSKENFFHEMMMFMLLSGVRSGEAFALTWDNVDFKNKVIKIRATYSLRMKQTPKSESSERDIPINSAIESVLKSQRKKMEGLGWYGIRTNVFLSTYGNIVSPETLKFNIEKIASEAGIERFTSHAFRDTFATRYIEAGGTPKTLQTILGHSTLAMTMDLYAHVLPDTKAQEMERIKII